MGGVKKSRATRHCHLYEFVKAGKVRLHTPTPPPPFVPHHASVHVRVLTCRHLAGGVSSCHDVAAKGGKRNPNNTIISSTVAIFFS